VGDKVASSSSRSIGQDLDPGLDVSIGHAQPESLNLTVQTHHPGSVSVCVLVQFDSDDLGKT